MSWQNTLNVFVSKRRWLKRLLQDKLSDVAWVKVHANLTCYFSPKNLHGPSHHLAFKPDRGFYSNEEKEKSEILGLLKKGGAFVDIGANIGLFSLFIAEKRPDVQIFAYEPESIAHRCLNHSIHRNGFNNINLKPHAIGEQSLDNSAPDKSDQFTETVETRPLTLSQDLRVDMIKIDVKGAEVAILKGSLQVIRQHRPALLVECNNEELGQKQGVFAFFAEHFKDQIRARVPGTQTGLTLDQLSALAERKHQQGRILSNYLFEFS